MAERKIVTRAWEPADYIETPEDVMAALEVAFEDGDEDPAVIREMLGAIARSQGMTKIADAAGVNRESLYKAFKPEVNAGFDTIYKAARAMGFRFKIEKAPEAA